MMNVKLGRALNRILDNPDLTVMSGESYRYDDVGVSKINCLHVNMGLDRIFTVFEHYNLDGTPYYRVRINGEEYFIDEPIYTKVQNYNDVRKQKLELKQQEEEQKARSKMQSSNHIR